MHRDLKPANVFIEHPPTGAKTVRVMDFGIAKVVDSSHTRTAMALGTPAYMSPEQIRSPKDVDARTDLFAVGTILYEMLTGKPAFQGDTEFDIQSRIVQGRFTPLREAREALSGPIEAIVERALSVDPADRFQDAASFSAALDAIDAPAHAPPPSPPEPPRHADTDQAEDEDEEDWIDELVSPDPSTLGPQLPADELRAPLQILLEDVMVGDWHQDGPGWQLIGSGGLVLAKVTPGPDALEVQIRSGRMRGREPFVPRAEELGGWPDAACQSTDSSGWYEAAWVIHDARGGHRLAWLITQEWGPHYVPAMTRPQAPADTPSVTGSGLLRAGINILGFLMCGAS